MIQSTDCLNKNVVKNPIFTSLQRSSGKVMFSVLSVCYSVSRRLSDITLTQDILDLTMQGSPVQGPNFTTTPVQGPPDMFKHVSNMFELVYYGLCTVGKQMVGILKCFLASASVHNMSQQGGRFEIFLGLQI